MPPLAAIINLNRPMPRIKIRTVQAESDGENLGRTEFSAKICSENLQRESAQRESGTPTEFSGPRIWAENLRIWDTHRIFQGAGIWDTH